MIKSLTGETRGFLFKLFIHNIPSALIQHKVHIFVNQYHILKQRTLKANVTDVLPGSRVLICAQLIRIP